MGEERKGKEGRSRRMVERKGGRQVKMQRQEETGESNEGLKTMRVEGWGMGEG